MLQQERVLATLSLEDKLQKLTEFAANPWFGYFQCMSKQHEKDAMVAILNTIPSTVENFFNREQAFGEINGSRHSQQDYFDVVDALLEELEQRKTKKETE